MNLGLVLVLLKGNDINTNFYSDSVLEAENIYEYRKRQGLILYP